MLFTWKVLTRHGRRTLTAIEVGNAKPGDKPRKLRDGNGLILLGTPTAPDASSYVTPYTARKRCFSSAFTRSCDLPKPGQQRRAARQLMADGVDPVQNRRVQNARKTASAANTFRCVAEEWLTIKQRILAPSTQKKIKEYLMLTYIRDLAS
ncbi:integrase arm-type DNA-binding domain-containing protein [Nitrosovibrio tenuis]|uniref:Integrase DNA-binding domain-containing protein n=1 Tax=Nitrosovibrio tenuis TaxID=1233 RepID=A0A1H7GCD3_9PROT|nr:integrase arm-type DNA-binding domain-containing protein [Nitrosovibrio tenuis]SEK34492.1 hypothetical protein SAMN05216387_101209 [Nitrosovibrio tenuis]